ncbi:MAG: hypothetical protein IKE63_06850 [Bacilli bacterium]|nr:hypothetical protein [Bacilli bacterium]
MKSKGKKKKVIILCLIVCVVLLLLGWYLIAAGVFKEFESKYLAVNKGTIRGIHYTVGRFQEMCHSESQENNYDYEKQGYYLDKESFTYHIMDGSKGCGNYNFFITKVRKNKGSVEIVVKETPPGEICPTWITCPNITITFDKDPGKVIIMDKKGNIFKKLN